MTGMHGLLDRLNKLWYTKKKKMALSKTTLEPILEAEGYLRAALKSAATNEKPTIVHQLSKILMDIQIVKDFEQVMDLMEGKL